MTHSAPYVMNNELNIKIQKAIRFLNSLSSDKHWEIAYSGGKDSDVLLWLCKQSNIKYEVVHKCTTIDPPGTLKHCLDNGATILRPKFTFLQLVEKKGLPTMFRRFCCEYLKEYYHAPYVLTGVRACESVKRSLRYTEPSVCRNYSKTKYAEIIMPLLNFTNEDIATIVTSENIQCHPLYYDADGQFHVERRLGCLGCPLLSDRGRADYKRYPILLRQVCKRFLSYLEGHPIPRNPYDYMLYQLFYSNHGEQRYQQNFHGLFPAPDPKQFMEEYFKIDLP